MSEQEKRIVKIIELPHQEGMPWYAENYINGKELEEREKNGTLSEAYRNELVVLGRELGARQFARELARKIGDDEWHQGNTKYAFEAYEAACATPSEILAKAEALLKAESLAREWENEVKDFIEGSVKIDPCRTFKTRNLLGYANVLAGACAYCPRDDCYFCTQKMVLNRGYANKVYEALAWDYPEPKQEKSSSLNSARDEVIADLFAQRFLLDDGAKKKYRAAAVAALKLVNRLERIYITEEPENGPLVHGDSIIA